MERDRHTLSPAHMPTSLQRLLWAGDSGPETSGSLRAPCPRAGSAEGAQLLLQAGDSKSQVGRGQDEDAEQQEEDFEEPVVPDPLLPEAPGCLLRLLLPDL